MSRKIILRFRDLVTEAGGTIAEHQAMLQSQGEVWWGWWMRQHEAAPRQLFGELLEDIEQNGPIDSFLFNTGTGHIYSCGIAGIRVAPTKAGIGSPDPERSPEYYNRGRYPAWFLLSSLAEVDFSELQLTLESLPTKRELELTHSGLLNRHIKSLEELRTLDVTLWVVRQRNDCA